MRIAVIVLLALAAPLASAQETETSARQPISVQGDFDRDGLTDRVDLTFADGQFALTVFLGKRPDDPYPIDYGPEEKAGDFLEVRPGGTFTTPGTKTRRNPPPTTYRHDIFIYGKANGLKRIWSWSLHSFTSMSFLGEAPPPPQ